MTHINLWAVGADWKWLHKEIALKVGSCGLSENENYYLKNLNNIIFSGSSQQQYSARRVRALPVGLETSTSSSRFRIWLLCSWNCYFVIHVIFHIITFTIMLLLCDSFQWFEWGGVESESAPNAKISQHGCSLQAQQERIVPYLLPTLFSTMENLHWRSIRDLSIVLKS